MGHAQRINLRAVGLTLIEVAALLGDMVVAHGTFEVALDSTGLAFVLAAIAALLIFMSGEMAGRALVRGERGVAAAAFATGLVVVVGVGVVRGLFGLGGGGGAQGGVAAQLDTAATDDLGTIVLAVIVSCFMLGVLALGTKASMERAEERADRLASEIAVMTHRVFDLAQERTFLVNDLAAARVALRTAVEDIVAQVIACSLPRAASIGAADVMVDTTDIGRILATTPGAGASALDGTAHGAAALPGGTAANAPRGDAAAAVGPAQALSRVDPEPVPQTV